MERNFEHKEKLMIEWLELTDEITTIKAGEPINEKIYKLVNELTKKYNLSLEQNDELLDAIGDYTNAIIKTIARCPFLQATRYEWKVNGDIRNGK
ncbi:MAG: hypothetical protein IJ542_00620 [Clostridia bacterium]|nr:hypothetical protein [Clostridia bacterium]